MGYKKALLILILLCCLIGSAHATNNNAYVMSSSSNNLKVIDTASNTVTSTLAGFSSPWGAGESWDGSTVAITNFGTGTLKLYNTANTSVYATITVGTNPIGVCFIPDNSKIYVANFGGNSVSVVNPLTGTVITTISNITQPRGIAASADGRYVFVAATGANKVYRIDTTTDAVDANVTIASPYDVTVSTDNTTVFATNYTNACVSVFNIANNTVYKHVAAGTNPWGIDRSPDGSKVYATNYNSNSVTAISTSDLSVEATITGLAGTKPVGVCFTPDGTKAYVAMSNSGNMSVISTSTNTYNSYVGVGSIPYAMGKFMQPTIAEASPTVSFNTTSQSVVAGNNVSLNFTLDKTSASNITVKYTLTNGTGVNKTDYTVDPTVNKYVTGVYVGLGDSLTYGAGTTHNGLSGVFGFLLDYMPSYTFYNAGHSGYRTDQLVQYISTEVAPRNPDYVHVYAGTNDLALANSSDTVIEANLTTLYNGVVETGAKPILYTLTPRGSSTQPLSAQQETWRKNINTWIKNTATENGWYCVDLNATMSNPSNPVNMLPAYTSDGLHYSEEGYQAWADSVDYSNFPTKTGTVTIPAGQTSKTFQVNTLIAGADKDFYVNITYANGANIASESASTISMTGSDAYYVSPTGTGNGLSASTPGNITNILYTAGSGQTVYFLNGNYSAGLTLSASGNETSPIKFVAYSGTPTIQGSGKTGSGITITGDYVTVDGLTVINWNKGINVTGDNVTLVNNSVTNNYDGIYLSGSDYPTIQNNTVLGNLLFEETQDFESGLGDWTPVAASVASGNNTVANGFVLVNNTSSSGDQSLMMATHGKVGDVPSVWIYKTFNVAPTGDYKAVIETQCYSPIDPYPSGDFLRLNGKISTAYSVISTGSTMGNFDKSWNKAVTWYDLTASNTSFYASEGLYASADWSGYVDDIRVLAFGKDTHDGITILNSQEPLIQGNTVKYLANNGMYLHGCAYPKIESDIVEYTLNDAINTTSTCSYVGFYNSTIFKSNKNGIGIWSSNFTALNNNIQHTYEYSIESDGNTSVTPLNQTIVNNTIRSGMLKGGLAGAVISVGYNSTIAYNNVSYGQIGLKGNYNSVIYNNTLNDIAEAVDIEYRQYNVSLYNNRVTYKKTSIGTIGFRLKMIYNCTVYDNYFENYTNAIAVIADNYMNSERNTIRNNTIVGGGQGITAEDVCNLTITDNNFTGQTTNAIEFQGPIYTWSSFRNGGSNTGSTGEYVLPSPYGVVPAILAQGYTSSGLTTLWTSNLTTTIKSTPATYNNILYAVTNGTLYAINNNDGSQIWNYSTGNIYPSTVSGIGDVLIHSSPAVNNSVIYFGSGTTLYAVNTSGGLVWSYPTDGQVLSSPQISGGNVYVGSTDGKMYAIREGNGSLNWSYTLNDAIVSTPCVIPLESGNHTGILAKGFNGSVAQIYENGSAVWTATLPKTGGWSSPGASSYIYSNSAYVWSTGVSAVNVKAYEYLSTCANETGKSTTIAYYANNGTVAWTQNDTDGNLTASPEVNGGSTGVLSALSETGAAYLLDLNTGSKISSNTSYSASGFTGSPVAYATGIMQVDNTGTLYRDYQPFGSPIGYYWTTDLGTAVSSSLVHSYGKLFVCGENGLVYALVPPSNVSISGNTISNTPIGVYSYSTEASVHNNTFTNVPTFINYSQMFSLTGTIENNSVGTSSISIDDESYAVLKNNSVQNLVFGDARSKQVTKHNDISIITSLSKAGTLTRTVVDPEWNQSYVKWNDTGSVGTAGATATYKITGLKTNTAYGMKRDNTLVSSATSDYLGVATVSNSVWSEHTFTLEEITPPTADFTATPLSGNASTAITFTDGSTGSISSWAWDFDNDGDTDSTVQNPTYAYTSAGLYSVKLTVSNGVDSDSKTITGYILISDPNGFDPLKWMYWFLRARIRW